MSTIIEDFQQSQLDRIKVLAESAESVSSKELIEIVESDFEKAQMRLLYT